MMLLMMLTTMTAWADGNFTDDDNNQFTIHNAAGWDEFCSALLNNNKGYFKGKTVKLSGNITVTSMAGSSYHDFTGTFDGQGHTLTVNYGSAGSPINEDNAAPFRNVENGCVIKDLHVAGDIYTSKKYAAGIAGTQYGTVSITNCRSSVTIHSYTAGDGTHGGFVGRNGNGDKSSITIEGCLFDGKLLTCGTTATTDCSGFVGYKSNDRTVSITNSLYAPANLADGETEIATGATFVRNGSAGTNCYYTRTLGTAQGTLVYSISAGENVTMAYAGTAIKTYNVSGIKTYTIGIADGSTLYASQGDAVSLTLGHTTSSGYTFSGYSASAGTLSGTSNPYSLTMPSGNVIITANFNATNNGYNYIAADGTTRNTFTDDGITDSNITIINSTNKPTSLSAGWYVVEGTADYSSNDVTLTGDVHLILADGAQMNVGRLGNNQNYSITIYGQSGGTGTLNASANSADGAIYVNRLTVNGGKITAKPVSSGVYPVGIYTNNGLTINGGQVTAGDTEYTECGINTGGLTFNGGQLTAKAISEGQGISVKGGGSKTFTLSWRNTTDFVEFSSIDLYNGPAMAIASGKTFTDGTNYYISANASAIAWYDANWKSHSLTNTKLRPSTTMAYAVTFNSNGGSDVDQQILVDGAHATVPTTPTKEGLSFAGWYRDNNTFQTPFDFATETVTSNLTLYAKWVESLDDITQGTVKTIYRYTGSAIDLVVKNAEGATLTKDTDYQLTYEQGITEMNVAGVYTITVTGMGKYTGEMTVKAHVLAFQEYNPSTQTLVTTTLPEGEDNATAVSSQATYMSTGWYVATENVSVGDRISVSGDVHLVLCDGVTMTASKGISVTDGNSLTIYSQSGNTGKLIAQYPTHFEAVIGGTASHPSGTITIHGGDISASSENGDIVCIGFCNNITIYGGKITASHYSGFTNTYGIGGPNATVHLGWCHADDYVQSTTYQGTIIFDKSFVLENDETVEASTSNCNGQKMVPNTTSFYDISFNTNGAGTIDSQRIKSGLQAVQPANPVKQNHTFGGWYADANFSGDAYDFSTAVTASITLYAKWRAMYAVSFDKNASDATGAMNTQTLYVGEPENLPTCAFSRTGYTFAGWATTADGYVAYTDGESVTSLTYTAGASLTLYAQWTAIPYAITAPASFDVTVGGNTATTATMGQTVKLSAASGHSLLDAPTVTSDNGNTCAVRDAGDGSYTFTMPASNVSVVAITVEHGWKFIGTYDTQNFTASNTNIYGFVGTPTTSTAVGTFVQVGGYVRVKPLRAYLQAPAQPTLNAPARRAMEDIPSTLRVRLLNSDGETTGILTTNFTNYTNCDDAWYSLDGRKFAGEPTQRGIYINKGKKVIIK